GHDGRPEFGKAGRKDSTAFLGGQHPLDKSVEIVDRLGRASQCADDGLEDLRSGRTTVCCATAGVSWTGDGEGVRLTESEQQGQELKELLGGVDLCRKNFVETALGVAAELRPNHAGCRSAGLVGDVQA